MNPFEGSTFRPVNTDLQNRRGGYRPGTIGVSNFQGKTLNYSRPGVNPLRMGAGVSTMRNRPQATLMQPNAYNLYKREPVSALYSNLYK